MIKRLCSIFLLYRVNTRKMCFSQACFKRRATAVLSWLDCSSTAAPGHYHDLVSDVNIKLIRIERLSAKTKHKNKGTV